jgi:hypothetical protein
VLNYFIKLDQITHSSTRMMTDIMNVEPDELQPYELQVGLTGRLQHQINSSAAAAAAAKVGLLCMACGTSDAVAKKYNCNPVRVCSFCL